METPAGSDRRDSQQTFISLLQLDPAPMETPPETDKDLPPLPLEAPGRRASTVSGPTAGGLGLGAGGHGAMYYLARVQRYSSYAMSVFTSLHLASVSLIPFATRSVAGSETYLLMAREMYQTPVAEPLLVALPVVAHVGSGVALRLLRRRQNVKRYGGATPGTYALHRRARAGARPGSGVRPWPPLSYVSLSGYALAAVYAAHVAVNRLVPLAAEGDSASVGLGYVAHGFARHPGVSLAAYAGLIAAGCGHMVWGMAKWLGLAPSTGESAALDGEMRRRRRHWLGVHGVALGAATLWAAGGLGIVARGGPAEGWLGGAYDDMFARVGL